MRRALLFVLAAGAAHAQYYYTDTFASYNSGAWAYPTGSGLVFSGSGLRGSGSDFTTGLVALSNGGNGARQEIKATISGFPTLSYQSVDLWLASNSTASNGY